MSGLTVAERDTATAFGRHCKFAQGDQVFTQGEPHAGIMMILDGEIRSYYIAPSGREITLAYWTIGHFVGGTGDLWRRPSHLVRGSYQGLRGPVSRKRCSA